jgi:hypothetical protein
MNIKTNNKFRPILYWHDLTAVEQNEFDWVTGDIQDSVRFVRYKGEVYPLEEFMPLSNGVEKVLSPWSGSRGDSYFSGLLIRYDEDCENVVVGMYTC